jgi:hypothetical protein
LVASRDRAPATCEPAELYSVEYEVHPLLARNEPDVAVDEQGEYPAAERLVCAEAQPEAARQLAAQLVLTHLGDQRRGVDAV